MEILKTIFENPGLVDRFKEDYQLECDELCKRFIDVLSMIQERKQHNVNNTLRKRAAKEEQEQILMKLKRETVRELSKLSIVKKERLAILSKAKSKHEDAKAALKDADEDDLLKETMALEEKKTMEINKMLETHKKFQSLVSLYENSLNVKIKFTEPDIYTLYFSNDLHIQLRSDDLILWKISQGSLSPEDLRALVRELSTSRNIAMTLCRARTMLKNY